MNDHSGDIEAIKQLKARYFRTMDTKDWEAMRNVFSPDVHVDVTDDGAGTFDGVDTFLAMLTPMLAGVVTVHHGHMPEITLESETSATGVWAMEDHLWFPQGSPLGHLHGYGHYHETYEKAGGEWRITSSTLTRLHTDFVVPEEG